MILVSYSVLSPVAVLHFICDISGLKWACDIDKTDSRRLINADIICITSGLPRYSPELRMTIYEALAKRKVIISAAIADDPDSPYEIHYPARFGDIICVGSQSENGTPSAFTPPGGRFF